MMSDGVAQVIDDSHMEEDEPANEALEQVSSHSQLLLHSLPATATVQLTALAGSKHYHHETTSGLQFLATTEGDSTG